MSHKFEIKQKSDEVFDIYLDGTKLMQASHDDHGWSAMTDFRKLVNGIAAKIGAEVVVVDVEDEDY